MLVKNSDVKSKNLRSLKIKGSVSDTQINFNQDCL